MNLGHFKAGANHQSSCPVPRLSPSAKIGVTGSAMLEVGIEDGVRVEATERMIRAQLELLIQDDAFRSSKRSVAFLRYVVEQTLNGSAESLKERTIGVEVFGRKPSYNTNLDHVVRTAATELRKRLAIYYGDERHRSELRMGLIPGSYIPKFTLPPKSSHAGFEAGIASESTVASVHLFDGGTETFPNTVGPAGIPPSRRAFRHWGYLAVAIVLIPGSVLGYHWLHRPDAQELFWKPLLDSAGSVLLAVGDVPDGPPIPAATGDDEDVSTPVLRSDSSHTVPFADAVTIARVVGVLESKGKQVVIRRENSRSFSDLRESPVVLIGAFNNEWSLRLTHQLRYSLALDAEKHLIYIRDSKNPSSRSWSWATNQPRAGTPGGTRSAVLQDYALISRIRNSETGHVVVVVGGLYTYGTEAAGEFLTDPQLMQGVATATKMDSAHQNLQIVLETTVTDETPGPPKLLAVSTE